MRSISAGQAVLARARKGDHDAFRELIAPYARELQAHCYRILGSLPDAEDVVQDTLFAAWRGLDQYEGRASVRVWLYRIATNRCLNARRDRSRRPKEQGAMVDPPEPTRLRDPLWLEPYPDVLLDDVAHNPEARYTASESIALAFVAALQQLPTRQRCVLVLRDVLGFSNREVADILGCTENTVKGALQRARSTLRDGFEIAPDADRSLPSSKRARDLVDQFVVAVEAGNVHQVVTLLADDAWLTMPPEPYEYQGHEAIGRFLEHCADRRGANLKLVRTGANGQPAFGCYVPDAQAAIAHAYGLLVLTLGQEKIEALTWFGDRAVMSCFGLPRILPT